jgi:uncharacterized protein YecE (DUF72 family)
MGWSYDFWKGGFYPKELNQPEFLAFYSKQFNTVEADSTFYRIPREQTMLEWKKQTPSGFSFSLKFPRKITHIKMLRNASEETQVFLKRVELLGEKLGPLLLQLPPNFKDEGFVIMREFLRNLPDQHQYVVEVRNNSMLCPDLYMLLRENKTTLAWVDKEFPTETSERTGGFIYLRWEGDRKKVNGLLGKVEVDRTASIETWVKNIKPFVVEGTEIYGYFSKYYSGLPTADAQHFLKSVENSL